MDMDYEGAAEIERAWREGLTPDPLLTVSEWSDRHRMLSSKASAEPGRWRTSRTPYLKAIMDCLSPTSAVERVVFMKAAQLGATEMGSNWIGYVIHHAPGPMMAVWPTVEMAKRNSKQRIDPLIEESSALAELIAPARSRDSGNTILAKEFRGGVLVMTGANSAVGLRSMPVRYLFLDEVDGYPLVSVRDYYTQKTAIDQREVDAEIARKQQELARSQQVATTGKSENDRLRAKAEVAKAEADLITLNNRRTDIEQANARKAAQAERELADALAQAREELAQITGTATDADRQAAIERSYRDLRARLAAESDADGVSLVDRLINVKAAQANLAALESQWRQVTERLRNAQEAIQTQQQAGLLTEAQARQQIVALQQQSATEMERLLPTMQQAVQAIGPDAVIRVQAWRNELDRTKLTVDEMAPLWNRIGESFGGALNGMITGAQTWRSALASIFQQVADAFLQQIVIQPFQQWIAMQARMLALKLGFIQQEQTVDAAASAAKVAQKTTETTAVVSMDAAKAGAGAAASQASIPYVGPALAVAAMVAMVAAVMALLGGIKKFAGGGLVSGPGSATSDSIPARLSAGEYVVRAAAVRQVGVAFLDSLNGLSAGPRFKGGELAFAAGGLVPEVKVPPAQPQMNQAVRIVNAVDPGVTHDHLQSPAGEKVIVNIIGRNARAIRAALQG